ncbi:hypothetical protein [Candidatus Leptofilum sp.]|uniref:hypothetical protein n=1 Tax=Candidatus Leptofilum sp. TaxID=3241576 RepID=UPI003B5AEA9B
MAEFLYILYTLAHIVLLIWGFRLWRDGRKLMLLLILLPIAGLVYDNGVISLGRFLGEGELLQTLNQGRFLLHALITPLLIAASVSLAARAGVGWTQKRLTHALFGIITVALIGFGLVEFTHFVYEPEQFGNTLRYVDTAVAGPPIPAIITIIIIMIMGIFIWRLRQWPWLFLGGLIMFIGSAVPPSLVGPIVGSGVEVVLLASLLATWNVVRRA